MRTIQDLADRGLPRAINHNFAAHAGWALSHSAGATGTVQSEFPGVLLVDSGLDCDTFNLVCNAHLSEKRVRKQARSVLEHFDQRAFSWWLSENDAPDDLLPQLLGAGFTEQERSTVMARALILAQESQQNQSQQQKPLQIQRVDSSEKLDQFAAVLAANWQPADANVAAYYRQCADALFKPESPVQLYIGYRAQQAVCVGEITCAAGVAGIYNISTRREARHLGYATAMLHHLQEEAAAAGYKVAVLQASAEGEPVYRKLGFEAIGHVTELAPG